MIEEQKCRILRLNACKHVKCASCDLAHDHLIKLACTLNAKITLSTQRSSDWSIKWWRYFKRKRFMGILQQEESNEARTTKEKKKHTKPLLAGARKIRFWSSGRSVSLHFLPFISCFIFISFSWKWEAKIQPLLGALQTKLSIMWWL